MKTYLKIIIENGVEYTVNEYSNGDKTWRNSKYQLHRESGPAVEDFEYKVWYKHGKIHREDGAAKIYSNGTKFYYLNDIQYPNILTDEEWLLFQIIT